jgi:hypothetical protein
MTAYFSAGLAAATNSPFITACLLLLALFAARRWRIRNPLVHFLIQFLVFSIFTIVMLAANVVPYRTGAATGSEFTRLFVGSLEIIWWLAAASLTVGALRAFLVLGGKPSESKLVQDLLAGLIYLAAAVAIVAYVFDLPVKGLLATSGALAIIIGHRAQSRTPVSRGRLDHLGRYGAGHRDRDHMARDAYIDRQSGRGHRSQQRGRQVENGQLQFTTEDSRCQHAHTAGGIDAAGGGLHHAQRGSAGD